MGGLVEGRMSGVGVRHVVAGGLVRVGLGAGPVRVPVLVPWGLDLVALMWGGGLGGCWGDGRRD